MKLYLYRMIPPRPTTFAIDMTRDEAQTMQSHANYWKELASKGRVLVFGPVADPEGIFGIAVIVAADGEEVVPFCTEDPAIKSGLGFTYKLHPMPQFGLSVLYGAVANSKTSDGI
jgi:uncharacterized protein YciI